MSDRKYKQRGYQDDDRDHQRPQQKPPGERPRPQDRIGPRTYNMPGFRQVVRCARCGNVITADVTDDSRCNRCGADLRSCTQCVHFDTGRRFECAQPIPARVSPKDARNTCPHFEVQRRVERETTAPATNDARKAFDDLFK